MGAGDANGWPHPLPDMDIAAWEDNSSICVPERLSSRTSQLRHPDDSLVKLWFIARLIGVAAEAGAKDPYQLGHQLAVLFEGATALATSLNDTAALVHARSAAEVLIDTAVDQGL